LVSSIKLDAVDTSAGRRHLEKERVPWRDQSAIFERLSFCSFTAAPIFAVRTRRLGRPVRLTGQLFFDGSHGPCRPGRPASPKRASVWEVHPIYRVDVCRNTTVSGCPVHDESKWIPLNEFETQDEQNHEEAEPVDG
jgi:hypothetical protein